MPNETRIIPARLLYWIGNGSDDRGSDKMTILEKKPCPFCGKEPKGYPHGWYVECPECHIRINGISYENAVERWNTRHEPTCKNVSAYGYDYIEGKVETFTCSSCGWDGWVDSARFDDWKP